jgi:hypothetical protein
MRKVEEIARAICKSQTQSEQVWQSFVPEALAALKAMREPSDAMLDAGVCARDNGYNVTEVHEAMIDAAIAEHQSAP